MNIWLSVDDWWSATTVHRAVHRTDRHASANLSHLQPAWTQQRREQNGIYLYPAVNLKRK